MRHINDFSDRGRTMDMETFKALKTREALIEFEMVEGREGKPRAARSVEFVWGPGSRDRRRASRRRPGVQRIPVS